MPKFDIFRARIFYNDLKIANARLNHNYNLGSVKR
jgi:hypothetical protein